MATLDELIGSWTLSVRAANRAPRTVAQYVDESLAQVRRWMAEHQPELAPEAITRQHVESYLAKIASTPFGVHRPDPVQGAAAVLRLGGGGGRGSNQPNGERASPHRAGAAGPGADRRRAPSASGRLRVQGFEDRRDTAIIRLLLDTDRRQDELVGLRLADIDVVGHVAVALGKGGRLGPAAPRAISCDLRLAGRARCSPASRRRPATVRARVAHRWPAPGYRI